MEHRSIGVIITFLLAAVWFGCAKTPEEEVLTMIDEFPPWRGTNSFDWQKAVAIAGRFQGQDHVAITNALTRWRAAHSMSLVDDHELDSKPFLLLTLAFEVPERVSNDKRRFFKGWLGSSSAINPDGSANIAWPISWRNGDPCLLAEWRGSQGPPYIPLDHYEYLRGTYPFRK